MVEKGDVIIGFSNRMGMRVLATGQVVEVIDSQKIGDFGRRCKVKIFDGILDKGVRDDGYWFFYPRGDLIVSHTPGLWRVIKEEYQAYLDTLTEAYKHMQKVRTLFRSECG